MKNSLILLVLLIASCKPYEATKTASISAMSELSYPFDTKSLSLSKKIELTYTDQGSGTNTLLFIHGLGSYMPAWQKNIPVLSESYRCIAIDLPGYGKSSKGNHSYDMKFFADVVAEFIQELDLKNVTLVGHSMGGQIAITASLYHPALVDQLVLISPAGFETFHEGQKQWFRDVLNARLVQVTPPEAIQTNLAYNFYDYPKEADFMITDRIAMRSAKDFERYCYAVEMSVKGMVDQPVFDFLPKVNQPTLVIYGENDNLIPNRYLNPGRTVDVANKGIVQLPNGQLVMVSKSGHFTMFEKAEEVNEAIIKFISK